MSNIPKFTYHPDPIATGSIPWFYWLGNAAGNRALSIGDNVLGESDIFGIIGFLPGLPSVIIVVVLLFIGARAVMAKQD